MDVSPQNVSPTARLACLLDVSSPSVDVSPCANFAYTVYVSPLTIDFFNAHMKHHPYILDVGMMLRVSVRGETSFGQNVQ